ncbi:MAG: energy-coupling factor transporter transmembrane component T [Verrucomicrobiota bacterium]|nr:energy-coupling factor transporter transmembrane protein EcfT [Limisphaera sp.]MDW8382930.1 energy-coupling factor transporter transmembrane component T [Verrucomicrobiota bacterium]
MLFSAHVHVLRTSGVHRWPAGVKLAGAVFILLGTTMQRDLSPAWFTSVWAMLAWVWWRSRLPVLFVLQRLLWLSPLIGGVAVAAALRPTDGPSWQELMIKSGTSLCTIILLAHTTAFGEVLRVLRRLRVPMLLVTTLALMHRYLFVLLEEALRMQRARAARMFGTDRSRVWLLQASVAGRLFVRAGERSSRIYRAMLARGGP